MGLRGQHTSTLADYERFWQQARAARAAQRQQLCEQLYGAAHHELLAYYQRNFGGELAALTRLPLADPQQLRERQQALALKATENAVSELLAITELVPYRTQTLVGLSRACAWTDDYDGALTAFFAVEQLDGELAAPVSAAHELTHVAHVSLSDDGLGWPDWGLVASLVSEALAVAVSRHLVPAADLGQLLLLDDAAQRLAACEAQRPAILAALLGAVVRPEDNGGAYQEFFYPQWGRPPSCLPERCGYVVADWLGSHWQREHSLAAIARWELAEVQAHCERALRALADEAQ